MQPIVKVLSHVEEGEYTQEASPKHKNRYVTIKFEVEIPYWLHYYDDKYKGHGYCKEFKYDILNTGYKYLDELIKREKDE